MRQRGWKSAAAYAALLAASFVVGIEISKYFGAEVDNALFHP